MGNAESGGTGSGDEEDIEAESPSFTEGGPASAAAPGTGTGGGSGGGSATGGSGSGRSGRGSSHGPVASSGLPSPEALMEQVRLREAAGRTGDTTTLTVSESAIARNESALVRWLEERLGRGEEALTLEQFCDMLESRDAQRDECEEVDMSLFDFLHRHKKNEQLSDQRCLNSLVRSVHSLLVTLQTAPTESDLRDKLEKQCHAVTLLRCLDFFFFVLYLQFTFTDISPAPHQGTSSAGYLTCPHVGWC